MEPNLKGIQAYVALIHSNMDDNSEDENDVIEEEASLFMRNGEISSTQRDKVKNHCTTTFHINHSFPYYTSEKNLKHYIIPSGCSGIECVHNKELSGILLIWFKPQISLIFTSFLMVTVFWSSTNGVTRGQHHKGAAHYPSWQGRGNCSCWPKSLNGETKRGERNQGFNQWIMGLKYVQPTNPAPTSPPRVIIFNEYDELRSIMGGPVMEDVITYHMSISPFRWFSDIPYLI